SGAGPAADRAPVRRSDPVRGPGAAPAGVTVGRAVVPAQRAPREVGTVEISAG
ncbi:acyltransferase, partial [Micromonospora acroterricola]